MPLITVHMYEGRTVEQKRELVAALTEAIVRIAKTTPEGTQVIIHDVPRHNWAQSGKLASDS
jgi:4-oxalocrotonate tautomerase